MGNKGAERKNYDGGSMKVELLDSINSFTAGQEMLGNVHLQLSKPLGAYSITVRLEGKEEASWTTRNDKGSPIYHKTKRVCVNESITVIKFENRMPPMGSSVFPFQLTIPQDAPQNMSLHKTDFYIKVKYYVKAQVDPVDASMLNNKFLKSTLRCKQRVLISPEMPFVAEPITNFQWTFEKEVGIKGVSCPGGVTINKNYFYPGEMAMFIINLDNSKVGDACYLHVKHVSKITHMQRNMKWTKNIENKEESFKVAEANQIAEGFPINFEISQKRGDLWWNNPEKVSHAELYAQIETTPPISFMGQTYRVANYLEFYFSHKKTIISENSKQRFYFQMLRESLVKGGHSDMPLAPKIAEGEPIMSFVTAE